MARTQQINEEDLKKEAKARGERLVFLLNALQIPEEQKQAWMTLLPDMSFQEINDLMEMLEIQYIEQQTKGIDEDFKKDLAEIKTAHNQAMEKIDQNTIDKIKKLSDKI